MITLTVSFFFWFMDEKRTTNDQNSLSLNAEGMSALALLIMIFIF